MPTPVALLMKKHGKEYILYMRNLEDASDHPVSKPITGVEKTFRVFEILKKKIAEHPNYEIIHIFNDIQPEN